MERTRLIERGEAALAGLLAAGVALATGELVAGLTDRLSAPVLTVGNRVVDAVPRPVKDFAIETFGTNDKIALLVGIYAFVAIFGLIIGLVARKRFAIGAAGIGLFGAVGVWAASEEVAAPWWAGLPSAIGAIVGIVALAAAMAAIPGASHPQVAERLVPDRRGFLKVSAGAVAFAGVAAATGRWLQGRFSAAGSRSEVALPSPVEPAPALASGVKADASGVSPFITPNSDFYRIDVNLSVPQLAAEDWGLRIHGMVGEELEYTFDDILAMDMIEERITMTCVSNEIGGGLVGTATWLGVPLEQLLEPAKVDPKANQVVGRAFDGFTTGFPTEVLDGRPAMLAVGMNGEPLPLAHGFPARIVVPGLYGYVSATKWLTEIELTTFDAFDQYWVERDWSAEGPIKTMSRIDTPKGLSKAAAGTVPIAGVAWAQTRGIDKVEVRIDEGEWQEATLAEQDSTITWRQWVYEWDASPGRHQIECRATDGEGDVQTEERARPFPNGASGWHGVIVNIDE